MKRKVLHFVRKRSQLKASFIQNQILNHIEFDPVVIFCQSVVKKGAYDGGFAEKVGSDVRIVDLGVDDNLFEKYLFRFCKRLSFRQQSKLKKHVQEIRPNIMHFHYGTDAGIYLRALKNINLPKIVSFYGYECSDFPKRLLGLGKQYLKCFVYKYADVVLAMSPDMYEDIKKTGCPEKKIKVHYHGSDVQKFIQSQVDRQNSDCRFLIISGLAVKKGHIFLLKAFKKAFEINKNISLTIVGDGQLRKEIHRHVCELSLDRSVALPGAVVYGSKEHKDYFFSHDVFIHPSVTDENGDKEGIPGAIIEAMAAGLPVISTYHAGIPYVIKNDKTGVLVRERDVDALSLSIRKMAESSVLRERLGKEAQKYAVAHLNLMKKEEKLERIYFDLLKNYTNDREKSTSLFNK